MGLTFLTGKSGNKHKYVLVSRPQMDVRKSGKETVPLWQLLLCNTSFGRTLGRWGTECLSSLLPESESRRTRAQGNSYTCWQHVGLAGAKCFKYRPDKAWGPVGSPRARSEISRIFQDIQQEAEYPSESLDHGGPVKAAEKINICPGLVYFVLLLPWRGEDAH